MNLVVLDGYTLNPGDLSWDNLQQKGNLTVYDRTPLQDIVERAKDAEAVFTNKVPLNADTLGKLPKLRYIGVLATGYNIIDVAVAKQRGVVVSNVPGYGTDSVVQMTFALLLELCQRVQRHSDSVSKGKWSRSPDFCFWEYPLVELSGKTLGIIGFGDIGQRVADVASAFGMKVLGYSRTHTDQSHRRNFSWASLDELLEQSDVVSIHCPLTPATQGLIHAGTLAKMKKSAFLLNTSRGPIIVEEDLADALKRGQLAGAGLDVLSAEPPPSDHPLIGIENCLITPHISWATREARSRMMEKVVANWVAYLQGQPIHVVNT
ncbi:D-2-hydroxyacid dehydrogenase [Parapedobacter sp. GCM10030251]|uniref:D-2-hydroxyacid dehydrogenase n=1 Tax=Parapedobacter sp. GCM10030251 TaxID=3273419 RepID=UPI00360D524D